MLKLGVVGTSRKENEKRAPIHPDHFSRVPERLRRNITFEEGYGEPFGVTDKEIVAQCGGIASRKELLEHSDVVLLPKPVIEDVLEIRENGILWGWPHCVQQKAITQAAIDRKLTLIAFEEMFVWGPDGGRGLHTFYKNNEMAGYCSVLDALRLMGVDGHYGPSQQVVVLSFGGVSRGAIYALKARGFTNITICIQRPEHLIREEVLGCRYVRMRRGGPQEAQVVVERRDGSTLSLIDLLAETDIIVNGIFQDPNNPLMFVTQSEVKRLKKNGLIIDVSCDDGMGFPFAKPTTIADPMFEVGHLHYYAVDHSPTVLWRSSSWEISAALLKYLPTVMDGPESWNKDESIRRAIEIRDGVVQNPKILSFQQRSPQYPHLMLD
jgi:N5-(carboxyethyl)ornithine synthase